MKFSKVMLCAATAVASMAIAGAAFAEDAKPAASAFTFNVGGATSYTFRGIKNTYDVNQGSAGEVFGGVDWTGGPSLYAGVWVSNTGRTDDNGIEIDYYGGWKPVVGPISLDLGVIYYTYNDSRLGTVLNASNTLEWKAAASFAAGPATIGAVVFYADDFASTKKSSTYYEINGSIPVGKVTASAAFGQFNSKGLVTFAGAPDSYTTWNAGVTFPITDHVSLDGRYIGTDTDARAVFGKLAVDNQLVGTIKATF